MRIRDLCRPINESLHGTFENKRMTRRKGLPWMVDVMRNPSLSELGDLNIRKYGMVRAFMVGKDVLAWNQGDAIHAEAAEGILGAEAKKAIPFVFSVEGREAFVMVTDFSQRTIWHENRNTANVIRENPYMKRMFDQLEIGYYNEDIVGDWEEIYA